MPDVPQKNSAPDDAEIELDFDAANEPDRASRTPAVRGAPPIALTIFDPIPALRDITARVINLDEQAGAPPREADAADAEDDTADRTAVLLEDSGGFAAQPAAISAWAYALALTFNGQRNAIEAVEAFKEKYGQAIDPEQALVLQNELDGAMFLNSATFESNAQSRLTQYLDMNAWPAAHSGTAYPAEPQALMATVSSFFSAPGGPGALGKVEVDLNLQPLEDEPGDPANRDLDPFASALVSRTARIGNSVRGLIVPHIDLRVGGPTYAHAYRPLLEAGEAELIFILGVAHQNVNDHIFSVSQKDFETPLGKVVTDRGIAGRLHEASGSEELLAELSHRGEHSIEFQAALISALLANRCKRDVQIVPILCGSIESFMSRNLDPFSDPEFIRFTEALRNEIDSCGRKWCVMCSVDLSHVGPEFGHNSMIDERLLRPVERMDRKLLKFAEDLDSEGFYREILRTQNSRHVDAVLAVLTMFTACRSMFKEGRLLHYDQMLKAPTHSAVSYAAMSFEAA